MPTHPRPLRLGWTGTALGVPVGRKPSQHRQGISTREGCHIIFFGKYIGTSRRKDLNFFLQRKMFNCMATSQCQSIQVLLLYFRLFFLRTISISYLNQFSKSKFSIITLHILKVKIDSERGKFTLQ